MRPNRPRPRRRAHRAPRPAAPPGPALGPALAPLVLALGLLAPAPAAAQGAGAPRIDSPAASRIDTLALREHTRFLADDRLRGRGTGTAGARRAARYIRDQLRRIGVPGAAADGAYLQPVPLREATIDDAATRVVVERAGRRQAFRSGEDFFVERGGRGAFRDFAGAALFVGTAGLARDALAGHERLDGRVLVLIGTLGSKSAALVPEWIRRGAAGMIFLIPDADRFRAFARARGGDRLYVDADVDDPVWQPRLPTLVAGPRLSAALLADAPLAPDALDGNRPFHALPLDRTVEATIRTTVRDVAAANVAAMIPGSDPARRDEVVVYTAHYDHLGIGAPDESGDSIYNGFSDNAAGVAMLLAIAETMVREPPARSVLFLFLTGEEMGLLGSSYYAAAPVVPLERTVAVINLDAGAPPAPPRSWRVAGGTASTLGDIARRVAADRGWEAEPSSARPNSDYWPFLRRGVPAVFLIPGTEWDGVDRAEREALHARWDRYHQPGDEWAPDFPFAGLQRYAEFALALGSEVANVEGRPKMLTADRVGS
ncbi:MAG TPA: M28 family peptidase [Longimicrobiales bacterium]